MSSGASITVGRRPAPPVVVRTNVALISVRLSMVCRAEVCVPSAIFARLTSISCENGSRRCAGVAIHPPTDATAPRGLRRLSSLYGTAPRRSTDLGKRAPSDPCSSGVDPCTAPVDRAGSSPVGGAGRHRRASATSAFCRFQRLLSRRSSTDVPGRAPSGPDAPSCCARGDPFVSAARASRSSTFALR